MLRGCYFFVESIEKWIPPGAESSVVVSATRQLLSHQPSLLWCHPGSNVHGLGPEARELNEKKNSPRNTVQGVRPIESACRFAHPPHPPLSRAVHVGDRGWDMGWTLAWEMMLRFSEELQNERFRTDRFSSREIGIKSSKEPALVGIFATSQVLTPISLAFCDTGNSRLHLIHFHFGHC